MNDSKQAWQTFWLAAATIFMVSLDATVIVAAFPTLRAHFSDSSVAELSWTLNGYTIVYAALLVPMGRMVDRLGHHRCFRLSTAGFTLASIVCAMAPTAAWLVFGRVLQAISAAMISPASLALILAAFPASQRSRSAGLWSAVGALAAALGPALGSLLIDLFSWRMIFLINLPIGLIVFVQASRKGPAEALSAPTPKFDLIGTGLLILCVGLTALGLSRAGEVPLSSLHVVLPLILGLGLMMGFTSWAKNRTDAALDLRLFADPHYRWASLGTLILGLCFGLMFLAFYLFFTDVWHYPPSTAGLAATPGPLIATFVAAFVSTRLARWGIHRTLLLGGMLFAVSGMWFALRLGSEPAYFSMWLPGQIVSGMAIGLMLPSLASAAVSHLPSDQLGTGSAANNALRQLGTSLGVALAVAIAGNVDAGVEPFRHIYLCLACCGGLIAGIAFQFRAISSKAAGGDPERCRCPHPKASHPADQVQSWQADAHRAADARGKENPHIHHA
jgi:EmrB/QacA subfamily drug resistance transporter